MKVKTSTGVELDTNGGWAKSATNYAKEKGFPNFVCALATHPTGYQEYLLLDTGEKSGTQPVFASQKYEDIVVHIDIHAIDKSFKDAENEPTTDVS